ncbi:hypothetical protein Fot_34249 [Forsythia ovata]|uniref:Uncharacterized protein n=1 Tax=Forsythia ovata TaxID=205694 RepID=A0ABD1SIT6_9LAMI
MKHDNVISHHFNLKTTKERLLTDFGNTIVNAIQDLMTRISNMPANQPVADNIANTKLDTMKSKINDLNECEPAHILKNVISNNISTQQMEEIEEDDVKQVPKPSACLQSPYVKSYKSTEVKPSS